MGTAGGHAACVRFRARKERGRVVVLTRWRDTMLLSDASAMGMAKIRLDPAIVILLRVLANWTGRPPLRRVLGWLVVEHVDVVLDRLLVKWLCNPHKGRCHVENRTSSTYQSD